MSTTTTRSPTAADTARLNALQQQLDECLLSDARRLGKRLAGLRRRSKQGQPIERGLADIENGLFFQGSGRFFSVWNPAELMRMGDDWAAAKAACQALVAEVEAKAKRK